MLNFANHLGHKLILFLPDDFAALVESQKRTEIVGDSRGKISFIFGYRMKVQQQTINAKTIVEVLNQAMR